MRSHFDHKQYLEHELKLCAAIGCGIPIAPTQFACSRHWVMIPRDLRVKIWAARHSVKAPASGDAARRAAVYAIAEQEQLPAHDI